MKSLIQTLLALSIAGVLLAGCQKKEEAPADATAPEVTAPEQSAPAEAAPEPAPAEPGGWVPPADSAAPAAPAEGAAAPAAPAEEAK